MRILGYFLSILLLVLVFAVTIFAKEPLWFKLSFGIIYMLKTIWDIYTNLKN